MADTSETPPRKTPRWRADLPHVQWRASLRWFAAEFLVVVSGVLVALWINAWVKTRQDAASEASYLALISRDLGQMAENLEELRTFEELQVRDGLRAYRILSRPPLSPEAQAEVSRLVSHLGTRRTMAIVDAAYEDLINTGNLQLIGNPTLRDRVVTFYETAEREFAVHNRNNAFFVDDQFYSRLFGAGLFFLRPESNLRTLAQVDSVMVAELAGGYRERPDPIWRLPEDAAEHDLLKSQLLMRMNASAQARHRASRLLVSVRELREAVDAERGEAPAPRR